MIQQGCLLPVEQTLSSALDEQSQQLKASEDFKLLHGFDKNELDGASKKLVFAAQKKMRYLVASGQRQVSPSSAGQLLLQIRQQETSWTRIKELLEKQVLDRQLDNKLESQERRAQCVASRDQAGFFLGNREDKKEEDDGQKQTGCRTGI
jgi:hypothetical protein